MGSPMATCSVSVAVTVTQRLTNAVPEGSSGPPRRHATVVNIKEKIEVSGQFITGNKSPLMDISDKPGVAVQHKVVGDLKGGTSIS